MSNDTVTKLIQPGTFADQLTDVLRNGAHALLAHAVNLFIFSMGSLSVGKEPIIKPGVPPDLFNYTDPMPQALVLTAIVISFATTALFLVVLLASRGLTDSDHVDGREEEP